MLPLKQILVAIDGSDFSAAVIKRAIDIAEEHGATLFIIHVIEAPFLESPYADSIDEEAIKKAMTDLVNGLNRSAGVAFRFFIDYGSVTAIIDREQNKPTADLLIIGARSRTDRGSDYIGTTASKLLQQTKIPVLLVKRDTASPYRHLFIPTNLSEHSKQNILIAKSMFPSTTQSYIHAYETISDLQAKTYQIASSEAKAIQLRDEADAEKALRNFADRIAKGDMSVIAYNVTVSETILERIRASGADLLVLDAKGVEDPDHFVFGSQISQLLYRSPIDVLVNFSK